MFHLAPSFGADDNLVAKQNGIGSLTLVDTQGRFVDAVTDFAGMYVKNEFYNQGQAPDKSADIQIVIKLKEKTDALRLKNTNTLTHIVGVQISLYYTTH